jgi:hypothetical protein
MSTTTTTGGIFTFDHDYKKLSKAIGVEEGYLDDLGTQVADLLKGIIFDDDHKELRDSGAQSKLVEMCANEFSYSQLVVLASFYLQDKIEGFAKHLDKRVEKMKASVKSIALDADDLPDDIKEMLENLSKENEGGAAIDGNTIPPALKDFLTKMAEEQRRQEGDGDDD